MKRIIMHWTAGGHTANATDKRHYHFIVDLDPNGKPRVVAGNQPVEANERIAKPNDGDTYAAHTRGTNTGSIGVAVAGMRSARERPFSAGPSPMTEGQIDLLVAFVADLAKQYGIPVTPSTVLTHAEVEPTLGIKQRNKWDIMWLPGMNATQDPIQIGNILRARIKAAQAGRPTAGVIDPSKPLGAPSVAVVIGVILAAVAAFFGFGG
jgi:N-acetyl-anhydromuramyl-L-alanine amidase AmpD